MDGSQPGAHVPIHCYKGLHWFVFALPNGEMHLVIAVRDAGQAVLVPLTHRNPLEEIESWFARETVTIE